MSKKTLLNDTLRANAEAELAGTSEIKQMPRPAEELLYELQVHQIELKMQIEALQLAQLAIEEMRDRYVDLYEFAPVGYITLTRAGTIADVNLTGAALLGVERNKLINSRFSHSVAPEDHGRWEQHFLTVLRRDGRQSCELVLKRPDGARFEAQITSLRSDDALSSHAPDNLASMPGKSNVCSLLRTVITDITESNRTKNELLEGKNRLQATLDAIPDLLFDAGLDGRIHGYHTPRADLLAAPPEAFLGKKFSEVLPPEVVKVLESAIVEAHEKGRSTGKQYELQLAQGKFWFELSISRKSVSHGQEPRFILLARDITERMQAKLQLRKFSTHMLDVREDEKTRIAREIHDDLGGTLLNLKLETNCLESELPADATSLQLHVENMAQEIEHAAGIMRNIITGLRPPILDEIGLLAALEWQASQFQKHSGIRCRVNCVGDKGNLDKRRSSALFRISQEALSNVAKHSGASSVEIDFLHNDEEAFMSVIDNGQGRAEKNTGSSARYGMLGMIERVDLLGGKISFPVAPAGMCGFNVTVILPLPLQSEDAT